jgi:hypothetical protein
MSKNGDIVVRLAKDVAAEIEVETRGDISCDFELKNKEEKRNWLRGIINRPGALIELRNEYGDVAIRRRS